MTWGLIDWFSPGFEGIKLCSGRKSRIVDTEDHPDRKGPHQTAKEEGQMKCREPNVAILPSSSYPLTHAVTYLPLMVHIDHLSDALVQGPRQLLIPHTRVLADGHCQAPHTRITNLRHEIDLTTAKTKKAEEQVI